tara:strand:+ start:112 stop:477 length:366 start_codon:yes stop_codon:yes gene_type:complete
MSKEILVNQLKIWIEYDNEIDEIKQQIRDLRKKEKDIKLNQQNADNKIKEIMRSNNLDIIDINKGKIQYSSKKVKKSLNKKYIIDVIQKSLKDENKINEIMNDLYNNRESKQIETLKFKKR